MKKFKKIEVNYTLKDIYNVYKDNFEKGIQVSKKNFKTINTVFVKLLQDKILLESEEVKLPMGGSIRVKKIKQKIRLNLDGSIIKSRLKIDFNETKKLGKTIYHLNENRDGHYYKIAWRRPNIENITAYSFIPERYNFCRKLSKVLKTKPEVDFFLD